MTKITYPDLKSDNPHHDTGVYSLGIRGWADSFEVHVDGVRIGKLKGTGDNKKWIDYGFSADKASELGRYVESKWPRLVLPFGRNAARALVKKLVGKYAENASSLKAT